MNTTTLNMTTLDGGNVIIKKGEGGGSTPPSGDESGSSWRYFDTTKATVDENSLITITVIFPLFKVSSLGITRITCEELSLASWESKSVVAAATDFNLKIYNPFLGMEEIKTIGELLNDMGGVEALKQELGFVEITEEEFYNLE